ncbi:MAG: HAMP domain-containing histidine kinase [Campylobacterales bacterium]|nr:HAMP domain-containing histidine kinase [Campylobacterales bacterium]
MLSKGSIRKDFLKQLVLALASLIAIFSLVLYGFIKSSIYEDIVIETTDLAKFISNSKTKYKINETICVSSIDLPRNKSEIKVVKPEFYVNGLFIKEYSEENKKYIDFYYPYNYEENSFIKISKDITNVHKLLDKIFKSIVIINIFSMILIAIYAFFLSNLFSTPINNLSKQLSNMNEYEISNINETRIHEEFVPLAKTINKLLERIQTFVKYQKELFIGIAHELKTPLAVMKLKNEVTLKRPREAEKYIEALELNIKTINEMNTMISNILEIGRQEGAHFEQPIEIDIIDFLNKKANDYKLLAKKDNKIINIDLNPKQLKLRMQISLLHQIVQNFVQNGIKFTPEGKTIELKSYILDSEFVIEVLNEGSSIKENIDYFAPFKREGNKAGAGLGLFLAKGAADALGGNITLKNRDDKNGVIASFKMPLTCPLQNKSDRKR